MPDLYDRQIARLRAIKNPKEFTRQVNHEWSHSKGLFAFAYPPNGSPISAGCLTMIRGHGLEETPQRKYVLGANCREDKNLTAEVVRDFRIPTDVPDITPESLDAFAEWQRKLDTLYGTTPEQRAFAEE